MGREKVCCDDEGDEENGAEGEEKRECSRRYARRRASGQTKYGAMAAEAAEYLRIGYRYVRKLPKKNMRLTCYKRH